MYIIYIYICKDLRMCIPVAPHKAVVTLTTYLWPYNRLIGIIVGLYSTVASLLDDATVGQNPASAQFVFDQNTP